jgi:hypothetical protein
MAPVGLAGGVTKTKRSQSADPPQMPRVPGCRLKRCGRGCAGPHPARCRAIDPSCRPPPGATASHYGKIGILPKGRAKTVLLFGAQKKAKTVTGYHNLASPSDGRPHPRRRGAGSRLSRAWRSAFARCSAIAFAGRSRSGFPGAWPAALRAGPR